MATNSDAMDVETPSTRELSLPWVEKYRPRGLDELIAHEDTVAVLHRLIDEKKLPHLLFYGPPGTGKTSTILACARKMYGDHYSSMVLELNASDDRGIDVVREQIKEFAGTKKLWSSGVKLIVLDEADAMTNDAQAALRRVIEKYTSNTRFCMVCNYVNKIIPALQSRCTKFRFSPLLPSQISSRLDSIIAAENVNATPEGRAALMNLSGGDMRRVLNLLQSAHLAHPEVNEDTVYLTAGAAQPRIINAIFESLLNQTFVDSLKFLSDSIRDCGYALTDIVTEIGVLLVTRDLPDPALSLVMDRLSTIELRLSHGASEKIQAGALVSAFTQMREMLVAAK